ncbi:PAS domain S-box protein [Leptospira wolffii]|uniref:MHYT domain-containing protein n=1 Tax=Leptospira wolffii TaxID=409998 RepID=UPI0010845E8A|nr:MHYT domain-containing protein [Leptospira wolffii]TGK59212.1 PAS domain S-box protein [Leptospira wolffii]TGK71407.1 PAS domain S-box protein [Leptospira wolffii]TGK75938.1 PAS domain S-box protein [Leptospira wolffii]TGL29316.1 PAS domain S-box protein [Leptospira wolffii]
MLDFLRSFFVQNVSAEILPATYNPWLVALSILIAIFASYIALQIVVKNIPESAPPITKYLVLSAASLALGCGVWSMHFIGMLSFQLCTTVEYDKSLTILSMVPSLFASTIALSLVRRPKISAAELILGGVCVGSGIGAMHYTGMAAMEMTAFLRYDPWFFTLSIIVAVILAIVSLWVRFGLEGLRLGSQWPSIIAACTMGTAISGMHYTGMFAARFIGDSRTILNTEASDPTFLALSVTFITIAFTAFAFAVNWFLRYRVLVQNLRTSESRLRTIITTAVDGIITIDAQGVIQDFNRSAELIFGYEISEVIGKNIRDLIPDPYYTGLEKKNKNELSAGFAKIVGKSREVVGIRKDGSDFPLRLAIGHAKLPEGSLFVGFVTDISERKMIETALKQSEQQVRSLIENIPGITYRCLPNKDWKMLFMSDASESVTGYSVADFARPDSELSFKNIIHPEDLARVEAEVDEAILLKKPFTLEYRIIRKNGEIRWLWENGCGLFGGNGEVLFLDGVILDITERRNVEEALRQEKEKAELAAITKTAFLANMSHEIRTPMNAILGFTEVLLSENLKREHRSHLETVKNSAKSLLRLLNDILNTAKLEKGAVELEAMGFSLFKLLGELKSSLGIGARKKNLQFEVIRDPSVPEFYIGDSLRIRQILTNLIGNAVKFTDSGKVTLGVERQGENLHFYVKDTGIGIHSDRLEKIFEPFTQADVSTTRRFGGTGLGTTICKQLTELMGGKIWAESVLGEGSTFHVLLPLQEGGGSEQERVSGSDFILPALKILVVDDMEKNTELVRLLLRNQGHTVIVVHSGEEAVQMATSESFDLILMDVHMPGLDGRQATQVIRMHETQEESRRTPIIALTASVLPDDRAAVEEAGMDGFIAKPVDVSEMISEIARVLGYSNVINKEKPTGVPSFGPEEVWDPDRASRLAELLSDSLQRGSFESEYLEEFMGLIHSKIQKAQYDSLRIKIEQFEFEEARNILKGISVELGLF